MGGNPHGESFEDEFSEELYNIVITFYLANAGPIPTAVNSLCSIYLSYSKKEIAVVVGLKRYHLGYAEEGGTPHLDRRHTVFGQLMDGFLSSINTIWQ